jgi:polar amino acid transport system permease protein
MGLSFDWKGVMTGEPLRWLASGLVTTCAVTVCAGILATVLAVVFVALRISSNPLAKYSAMGAISAFRNTPLLVQLLFWYFAAYGTLPPGARLWIMDDHPWALLPGGVTILTPEFIASTWGLGVFSAAFIAEEIRSGLLAVPSGQREAAASQGLGPWTILRRVLLPQAIGNAFEPVVGQYLNLMKLSSLACSIGLAEITYQVRQVESYNSHALEAFAVGTVLYLGLALVLERILNLAKPGRFAAKPGRFAAKPRLFAAKPRQLPKRPKRDGSKESSHAV